MLLANSPTGSVILTCLALIGGLGLLAVGIWLLRRWMLSTPAAPADEWSLQHLRDMHARGELTDAEFARLRSSMIAQYRSAGSSGDGSDRGDMGDGAGDA